MLLIESKDEGGYPSKVTVTTVRSRVNQTAIVTTTTIRMYEPDGKGQWKLSGSIVLNADYSAELWRSLL